MSAVEHPYSPALEADGWGYVSGALSVDQLGQVVLGRQEAMDAALERLRERLSTIAMGLSDVVKLTYFVTDITLRDEANVQLTRSFQAPRPARSFLEVSRLPYGATVEIEAVATKRKRAK